MIIKTIDELIKFYKGHTDMVLQYMEISPQIGIKLSEFEIINILKTVTKLYVEVAEELRITLEGDK